jgi:hypothetical protein
VSDPRVHRFRHSVEPAGAGAATNWLWGESDAEYVSKVADDCLLPQDWILRLRHAHETNEALGVVGASRLRPDDVVPDLLRRKLRTYRAGVELLRNHWVQPSGYLMRRHWVDRMGPLAPGQSWKSYCLAMAHNGAINGFLFPFVFEDHLADPRSEHALPGTGADPERHQPEGARPGHVRTLAGWQRRQRRSAYELQTAPLDLRQWRGWRRRARSIRVRLELLRSPRPCPR